MLNLNDLKKEYASNKSQIDTLTARNERITQALSLLAELSGEKLENKPTTRSYIKKKKDRQIVRLNKQGQESRTSKILGILQDGNVWSVKDIEKALGYPPNKLSSAFLTLVKHKKVISPKVGHYRLKYIRKPKNKQPTPKVANPVGERYVRTNAIKQILADGQPHTSIEISRSLPEHFSRKLMKSVDAQLSIWFGEKKVVRTGPTEYQIKAPMYAEPNASSIGHDTRVTQIPPKEEIPHDNNSGNSVG